MIAIDILRPYDQITGFIASSLVKEHLNMFLFAFIERTEKVIMKAIQRVDWRMPCQN